MLRSCICVLFEILKAWKGWFVCVAHCTCYGQNLLHEMSTLWSSQNVGNRDIAACQAGDLWEWCVSIQPLSNQQRRALYGCDKADVKDEDDWDWLWRKQLKKVPCFSLSRKKLKIRVDTVFSGIDDTPKIVHRLLTVNYLMLGVTLA